METTPPPSFADLVQSSLNAAVTPERIAEKVNAHVEKAVDEAIADALRSWSDTGKAIAGALKNSLRVDELNLPAYGHVVTEILSRQIQARVSEVVAGKLAEDMERLLSLAPKRAKLSELVAELLGDDGERYEVYCRIEWSEYSSAWVYLSQEKPSNKYEYDVRLLIGLPKKGDDYACGEVAEGKICSGTVKGSDLGKDVRFGWGTEHKKQGTKFDCWFGFEQKILAMYACGTVIEIDEDAVVTERY